MKEITRKVVTRTKDNNSVVITEQIYSLNASDRASNPVSQFTGIACVALLTAVLVVSIIVMGLVLA